MTQLSSLNMTEKINPLQDSRFVPVFVDWYLPILMVNELIFLEGMSNLLKLFFKYFGISCNYSL